MSKGIYFKLYVDWFKRADILDLTPTAKFLYLEMCAFAKEHCTDGVVTDAQMRTLSVAKPKLSCTQLVAKALLRRGDDDASWYLIGFLDDNKSKAEIEEIRQKRRESGAKGGAVKAARAEHAKQLASSLPEQCSTQSTEYRVQRTTFLEQPLPQSTVTSRPNLTTVGGCGGSEELEIGTAGDIANRLHLHAEDRHQLAAIQRNIDTALDLGWTQQAITALADRAALKDSPAGWWAATLTQADPPERLLTTAAEIAAFLDAQPTDTFDLESEAI